LTSCQKTIPLMIAEIIAFLTCFFIAIGFCGPPWSTGVRPASPVSSGEMPALQEAAANGCGAMKAGAGAAALCYHERLSRGAFRSPQQGDRPAVSSAGAAGAVSPFPD